MAKKTEMVQGRTLDHIMSAILGCLIDKAESRIELYFPGFFQFPFSFQFFI